MSETRTLTKAATFLDSIGANTKGGMYVDGYRDSALILDSLDYIGVTKVRDTFAEFGKARPVLDAMADAGIRFDFRVNYTLPAEDAAGLRAYIGGLRAFTAEHPGVVVSVEGVNEANRNSVTHEGAVGLAAAVEFQRDLFVAMKADPALAKIPVINLSLADDDRAAYARIGDLGRFADASNAHSYTQTGVGSDVQMASTFALARGAAKGDPLIVTEMGHTTLATEPGIGTSGLAQAKLLLSNLLLAYENGVQTTYIYDLIDTGSSAVRDPKEAHFGIFEDDGTPKPAAVALHNLDAILSHGDTGASALPTADYTLSNAPATLHSMLMSKSGGVYDIVLWNDVPVFNDVTDKDIQNGTRTVRVGLDETADVVRVYDPLVGLTPVAVFRNTSAIDVAVGDHPLVIEVGAATAVREPVETVASTLSMTADDFVSDIGRLSEAVGLKTIRLTDSHVLEVSSVETMRHLTDDYGTLLAKVEGEIAFEVTYGEPGWRKVLDFDVQGRSTGRTDYGLSGEGITSKSVYNIDGSRETFKYGITGQDWTTIHQRFEAGGRLTLFERLREDGSPAYRESMLSGDAKRYSYYDDAGRLATDVKVAAGGVARTTATYDLTTGTLAGRTVQETDGDVVTTRYTNGVKTAYEIDSHEGWTQRVTYDATTGKILTNYATKADGSATNKTYVDGILSKVSAKHADGSLESWNYHVKGQSYATEHVVASPSGEVRLNERWHADGTRDSYQIRNADGSRETTTYDNAGKVLTEALIRADGSRLFENHMRDGTGDVWVERSDASGSLLVRNIVHVDGDQDVFAFANGQTLSAGLEDDLINFRATTGGKAVYGGGNDTIVNFNDGDRLVLDSDWATRFADLKLTQQGSDVLIRFDQADSLVIKQIEIGDLHASHFLFA